MTYCVNIYLLSLIFVKLENRCILAAFAICVGGTGSKQTNSRGAIFQSCEVSQFCLFYAIFS
jgi:hypothetical protein